MKLSNRRTTKNSKVDILETINESYKSSGKSRTIGGRRNTLAPLSNLKINLAPTLQHH